MNITRLKSLRRISIGIADKTVKELVCCLHSDPDWTEFATDEMIFTFTLNKFNHRLFSCHQNEIAVATITFNSRENLNTMNVNFHSEDFCKNFCNFNHLKWTIFTLLIIFVCRCGCVLIKMWTLTFQQQFGLQSEGPT